MIVVIRVNSVFVFIYIPSLPVHYEGSVTRQLPSWRGMLSTASVKQLKCLKVPATG